MSHRLDPLLRPRSIAVVGASERRGSVGRRIVHNLLAGGFDGVIHPVNPGHASVLGLACHPDLASLPGVVEHVAFAVGDRLIESAVQQAIEHGARAVTIMSQLVLGEDRDPPLLQRVETMIRDTGLLACGGNSMGFYNAHDGVWMCGFDTRENHPRGGNVTLISHSGSGMSGIADCEERIDFNLAVSTGQEITVAMPDYMDFAIEAHAPRVIGLFMESARDPEALCAALQKANERGIPVVAIKVGRTALAARLAQSHSGALAGEDAAFQALFERYGVHRAQDMDEFTTALIMFAQPHPVAAGGLVSLHDSGGERQLLIDLADAMGTPLARLAPATRDRLRQRLDPGLPAVNPLDAWGAGGPDSDTVMEDCLAAMMRDDGAALGAVVQDRGPEGRIYSTYFDYLRAGHAASGKPAFLVSNRQGSGADPAAVQVTREGFPVLDGLRSFLAGVNGLLAWRDFRARPARRPPELPAGGLEAARVILASARLDEAAAMELLAACGLPANPSSVHSDLPEVMEAAEALSCPVVLKTAEAGLAHKTERRGVWLDLRDAASVRAAWRDLARRIGPRVLVAPMVSLPGVEMALGMVQDAQFGPLVMLGFGGERLEVLNDVAYALPPFDADTARRLVDGLKGRRLLDFDRGAGAPDLGAFCQAAAHFSAMVASLGDAIAEIDINPLLVHAGGCIALDALIVAGTPAGYKQGTRKAS